jgi:alkanesulfonate monooxygenase SsuD/methylene tetrahydromethanopterin reductase-like flavin-dependent oxidoreductase (luciferase family)
MLRPFRFGVASGETTSGSAWTELARRAEALGYATLLVPDHYLTPLTPTPALMAAAAVTTTLRVGCIVFANDFRHPALLAKEAATIDLLSGGRF